MKAIVTGSFDPITLGHMEIIKYACEKYEQVYVVALVNVCINGEEVSVKIADQNGDKAVNITDVVGLVNKCVNGQ